jgi:RHS repeat-associated protein
LRQAELGLYYYVARWYDPQTAHFTQADTVVPNAGDAASYDRYTYVRNNPVNYSDPSGHCYNMVGGKLTPTCSNRWAEYTAAVTQKYYGITYSSDTPIATRSNAVKAAHLIGTKLSKFTGKNASDSYKEHHGSVYIGSDNSLVSNSCETKKEGKVSCNNSVTVPTLIHEFGHVFENYNIQFKKKASDLDPVMLPDGEYMDWNKNGKYWERSTAGFICSDFRCLEHPTFLDKNQTDGYAKTEQFADLYMNFVLDGLGDKNHGFTNDIYGNARRKSTESHLLWVLWITK